MHDLVIRGGTIVDGTGAPARTGDVAIDDGVITAVGDVPDKGTHTIDADGALVTPGWVDVHTHYDGQVTWDEVLAPTAWHGVTTLVMGNCGVGFAPAKPDQHDWLIGLMEGVEDIPGTALAEGIQWEWETFPEYLDFLATRRWTMDVGTQVPHGAVRAYVMGERGAKNQPATAEDIAAMKAIVKEAVRQGALGFSTSRTLAHLAIDGEPVPGTFAAEDELFGIGEALGELRRGVFELAPTGSAGEDIIAPAKEVDWMMRLSKAIQRPVTYALLQVDPAPDLWRELMDMAIDTDLRPQVAGRPTGVLSGFTTTYCLFDPIPAYRENKARVSDPDVRAAILQHQPDERMRKAFERTFVLGDPPDYEPGPERSIAGMAAAQRRNPLEVAYDIMLTGALLWVPVLGYSYGNLDSTREMLLHPRAALGLADGGAHCGAICDASMPTFMLTHWVRDRSRGERLPLELVVQRQTQDTAQLYGLGDRGVLQAGKRGDVNVIDFDKLRVLPPEVVADLPAGGKRLVQGSAGYVATIKAGEVTFSQNHETGARPGGLLRGARE